MGLLKYIFMVIAAITAYQMLSGEGGFLTYNNKKAVNTDVVEINKTLVKVLDSQKEFQKQKILYADSIAGPFTKGFDVTGTGYVAELDRFADKIYSEDGTKFNPYTTDAAINKKTYVNEKGVKIYTAPIYEMVVVNGYPEEKTGFKIFVDASGYSAIPNVVATIENEICRKLQELAGEFRTGCNGTAAEKITSYSNSLTELSLTEKNEQVPDSDGFVSATIVEKYKI